MFNYVFSDSVRMHYIGHAALLLVTFMVHAHGPRGGYGGSGGFARESIFTGVKA